MREVLAEQAKAGLDMVSDGQARWHDPVSHLMLRMEGVRAGGLARWFDTNTYFRRPRVVGTLASPAPLIADEFKFARAVAPRPVTVTLTGPFSLSRLALPGGTYADANAVLEALTLLLAGEVGNLAQAGATDIVVEEHSLVREPGALSRVEDALEVLGGRKGLARLWLRLSFGDCAGLYEKLQGLPVDGLILDFTYGPALAEIVAGEGSAVPLGLGLVDARNTRLEKPAEIARLARKLLRRVAGDSWLTASSGLEFLPRVRAADKLSLLADVRDLLLGRRRKGRPARKRARTGRRKMAKKRGRTAGKPRRKPSVRSMRRARPRPERSRRAPRKRRGRGRK